MEVAQMLEKLVRELPEVYQPIFGHSEFSECVSRPCEDRLEKILQIHDALSSLLERPLKILDLGCAQGYFSFSLAQRGAIVQGIDYLDKNVALCNALAQEIPTLSVRFEIGRIEDTIERLEPRQFDMVLGLSVFHHIIHESGIDKVKALIGHIALQSGVLVTELALCEEPLYWASSQPQDPRSLLEAAAFVFEVARHPTHLAAIPRPLYLASNRYWIINGQAGQFDSWTTEPHALAAGAHRGSRRYYFGRDSILKYYCFDHPGGGHNREEFLREKHFLSHPPAAFPVPSHALLGETDREAWVRQQRLPGRLLLDLLREGESVDHQNVLLAVLTQLVTLESAGLYHNDVRTWNVLVAENGAVCLIDYGAISPTALDCVWPSNLFLAFFIFVREVVTGVVDDPDPLRTISISPFRLPEPYGAWAKLLWRRPLAEWSFKLMYETLLEISSSPITASLDFPADAWSKALEEAVQAQKLFAVHLRSRLSHVEGMRKNVDAAAEQITHVESRLSQLTPLVIEQQQRSAACEENIRQLKDVWGNYARANDEYRRQEDSRIQQAEIRILLAESRAQQAENRGQLVELEATVCRQQAEARAHQSDLRAQQAEANTRESDVRAREAEARAHQSDLRAQQAAVSEQGAALRVQELESHVLHNAEHAAAWHRQAQDWHDRVLALHGSTSWRITKPLRGVKRLFAGDASPIQRAGAVTEVRVKQAIRPWLSDGIRYVFERPALRTNLSYVLKKAPWLHQRLLRVAINTGIVVAPADPCPEYQQPPASPSTPLEAPTGQSSVEPSCCGEDVSAAQNLSPRARQIFSDLKMAIERHPRGQG